MVRAAQTKHMDENQIRGDCLISPAGPAGNCGTYDLLNNQAMYGASDDV